MTGGNGLVRLFAASVRVRIFGGFAVVLALLVALAVVALRSMQSVGVEAARVSQDSAQATAATDVALRVGEARAQVVRRLVGQHGRSTRRTGVWCGSIRPLSTTVAPARPRGQLADLGHPLPRRGGRDHHRDRGAAVERRAVAGRRDRPQNHHLGDRGVGPARHRSWPARGGGEGRRRALVPPVWRGLEVCCCSLHPGA